MFEKIIQWSLKNRLFLIVAAIVVLLAGSYLSLKMPVDVFPDLTAPTVTILTETHGMAPEEVETLVTFPIETVMNGATNVRRVRSSSTVGLSIVWVEFEWDTNIYIARQLVTEKLQLITPTLPPAISQPVMAPISSIMGEIMLISLSSELHSPMEIRTIADRMLRRRLLAVPGVSQVVTIGGEVKQYQVMVSPKLLKKYGVTLEQVSSALSESNVVSSGGFIVDSGEEYLIRGLGRIRTLEDISNSVVSINKNVPLLVKHVAKVQFGPKVKRGDASVNATPAAIISIQKQPKANTLKLTKLIEKAIDEIEGTLPEGVVINKHIFRQADFIQVAVNNVLKALRDGGILVVVILFVFLANLRTTFISALAIPLSLIITVLVLKLFNLSINTMTLGGMTIAVGVLVDDAIIFVENIFRRLKENRNKPEDKRISSTTVILHASNEIRSSVVAATFIIILVFAPLFFLGGIEGRMFMPLGLSFIVSILASLVVAVTITPALCSYLLPNARFMERKADSFVVVYLKQIYLKVLNKTLKYPKVVICASAICLIATASTIPLMGRSFLPDFNEGTLTVTVGTVPGTSLVESNKIGKMAEEILLSFPEVISTARRTGRAELDEHAQTVNFSEIDVRLRPLINPRVRAYGRTPLLVNKLRQSFSLIPGAMITIGQPISHRIDHILSGTEANIVIKLFGSDIYELRNKAEEIRKAVEGIPGMVDLMVEQQTDIPQVRIKINRHFASKYGSNVAGVSKMIQTAFNGETVSRILDGQYSYDLFVRFDEKSRGNIDLIKSSLVDTPIGAKIPLSKLASIYKDRGPNFISRENVQRKIIVQANVAGRDLGSVVNDIRERIKKYVKLPKGYYVVYGGQFESQERASRIIGILSIVAIVGIWLILYTTFKSSRYTLIIMANLPLALIGGVIGVFLSDGVLNVASMVGFITLFGIATRNGLMMISYYAYLMQEEKLSLNDAIIKGSLQRLRPILMTALTTGLALVPLVIAGDKPGNEIESPMAIVILCGLFSSTLLNMIVVPSLFFKFVGTKKQFS
ncbi:MAG: acriflavin resistance protein AcrB [Candidatus Scalindua rubra]|uniref:Acriflavin resistance protein AcrB n=1 Tax=Candidatus Scalindua rubra TaxID=1872076 RepID=A0A1E3X363_9BACT|nr:MAG: acriflavin resistance protein AcrB [Candidatus Scalindua rubra]